MDNRSLYRRRPIPIIDSSAVVYWPALHVQVFFVRVSRIFLFILLHKTTTADRLCSHIKKKNKHTYQTRSARAWILAPKQKIKNVFVSFITGE